MAQRKLQTESSARKDPAGPEYVIEGRSWRVRDMPEGMRPREMAARLGVANVPEAVLLAIVLRSGTKGVNVADLAGDLLKKHGSLTALASCSVEELSRVKGIGPVKAQVLASALEIGRRLGHEAMPKRDRIKTADDVARRLRDDSRVLDKEAFWVLNLDSKNYLKGEPWRVTEGLLDASLAHPREVFREAIRCAAAAVVVVHNHPSGDPAPSAEDIRITKQLVEAGRIVDIRVLDHVIIGKKTEQNGTDFLSMREAGVVSFDR